MFVYLFVGLTVVVMSLFSFSYLIIGERGSMFLLHHYYHYHLPAMLSCLLVAYGELCLHSLQLQIKTGETLHKDCTWMRISMIQHASHIHFHIAFYLFFF